MMMIIIGNRLLRVKLSLVHIYLYPLLGPLTLFTTMYEYMSKLQTRHNIKEQYFIQTMVCLARFIPRSGDALKRVNCGLRIIHKLA